MTSLAEFDELNTKSGLLMDFGNTVDSAVEAQGKTPVVILKWALARVQDRKGNYWSVSYDENTTEGEHYPRQISYAGNTSTAPVLIPYAAVRFVYTTPRPDIEVEYLAGAKVSTLRRLDRVQTFINIAADGTGGTLVRDFRVAYTASSESGRSLVQSLQDCDNTGACLPATSFAWQQLTPADRNFEAPGSGVWGGPVVTYTPINGYIKKNVFNNIAMVDLNGDGKTDMLKSFENGTWQACLSTGTAFNCQNWTGPAIKLSDVVLGDFNGDGRIDFLYSGAVGQPIRACLSTGTGFNCVAWAGMTSSAAALSAAGWLVGDFDGDGRDDLGGGSFCYSTGSTFNCLTFTIPPVQIAEIDPICPEEQIRRRNVPGDLNGDGRTDYLVMQTWAGTCPPTGTVNNYSWQQYNAIDDGTTRGFVAVGPAPGLPNVDLLTGEATGVSSTNLGAANGDLYPDIVLGNLTGNVLKSCRNTGQGFVCSTPTTNASTSDYVMHTVADFDGDGRPDSFHKVDNLTARVCQLGMSSALSCQTWTLPPPLNVGVYGTFGAYGDFNGDGKTDFAIYDDANQRWVIQLAGGPRPDLLSQVTNGIGHVTQVSYRPISDNSVYTRDTTAVHPVRDLQDSTQVVSQTRITNSLGGWLSTDYAYGGLKTDLSGRGSLGMRWMQATDQVSHVATRTEFSQTWPYTGMQERQIVTHVLTSVELARIENTLNLRTGCSASGQLPYVSASVGTAKDLNAALLPQVNTTTQVDCYGNPTNVVVTRAGGGETYSSTTVATFDNAPASWRIGELRCSTVTKAAPSVASITRTKGFDYDSVGLLLSQTVEPKSGTPVCATGDVANTYQVKTDYTRDGFGNVQTRTLNWKVATVAKTRKIEEVIYEPKGRFPQTVKNALDQAESRAYSEAHGQLTSLTGPNLLTTAWQFDAWGRKTREDRADTTYTTWQYRQCQSNCNNGVLATIEVPSTAVPSVSYLDALGREVRRQTWSMNGTEVVVDREYDGLGRLLRIANRRFATDLQVWTNFEYDDLGRVWRTTDAEGVSTIVFNGLDRTTTNAKIQNRKETLNALGLLRQVTDHNLKSLTYRYEPWGHLDRTTDSKGNIVSMGYDRLGRKQSLNDPDLGLWTYDYTPIGEKTEQIDPVRRALSQKTTYAYDDLGRMTLRTEPDAASTWTYDSCSKGIGKLCQASGANGYQRTVGYDSLGRVASVSTNLDGTYISAYTYSLGKLASATHTRAPLNGTSGPSQGFNYIYNGIGFLKEVQSGAGISYWRANSADARNRVTQETEGNALVTRSTYHPTTNRLTNIETGLGGGDSVQKDSYHYDALGNLDSRTFRDGGSGMVSETFVLDQLNRLKTSTIGSLTKTYDYDELGSLIGKTGVGTYAYPPSGALSVRPHAVSSITGALNGIANPSFAYDNSGNLLSGAGRVWTWTTANMPNDISYGSYKAAFLYDTERRRVRQTVLNGASTVKTIHYAGAMEKEVAGSVTQVRTYLPGGNGVVIETTGGSNPGTQVRYFHRDHLGSVTAISDASGAVLERLSYDAWGRRRNPDGSDAATNLTSSIDDTGYTGHEMLDDLGLVHINGRIHDPTLGRVASADPTVPSVANAEGFNRYSYAFNNPITWSDPSGFEPDAEKPHVPDIRVQQAGIGQVLLFMLPPVMVTSTNTAREAANRDGPPPMEEPSGSAATARALMVIGNAIRNVVADSKQGMHTTFREMYRTATATKPNELNLPSTLIQTTALFGMWATADDSGEDLGADKPPELPTGLTGQNPRESSGKRVNTDLPGGSQGVFDGLSGGKSTTQDNGDQVAPNGVRLRPGKDGQGPRIDIPANGSRPPETVHFPPGG